MNIILIINGLAYRLNQKGELEVTPFDFTPYVWDRVPPVAVRTPRQEAMLAHIKAALETAETSQL